MEIRLRSKWYMMLLLLLLLLLSLMMIMMLALMLLSYAIICTSILPYSSLFYLWSFSISDIFPSKNPSLDYWFPSFSFFFFVIFLNIFMPLIHIAKKPENPKWSVSFFSRITYHWFTSLTWIGFRRPITSEDVWNVRLEDQSDYNYQMFQTKLEQFRINFETKKSKLLRSDRFKVSIIRIIWSNLHWYLLGGSLAKLVNDILIFLNPMIMKLVLFFCWFSPIIFDLFFYFFLFAIASIPPPPCNHHLINYVNQESWSILWSNTMNRIGMAMSIRSECFWLPRDRFLHWITIFNEWLLQANVSKLNWSVRSIENHWNYRILLVRNSPSDRLLIWWLLMQEDLSPSHRSSI